MFSSIVGQDSTETSKYSMTFLRQSSVSEAKVYELPTGISKTNKQVFITCPASLDDKVLEFESEGCGFESCSDHIYFSVIFQ